MKLFPWIKWLTLFWSMFLLAFFIMWLTYLSDKFGPFADFFNPLPQDMGFEAQNASTWMYVSAFFPDLLFSIIPYWIATLGFWLRARWALWVIPLATGGWFYSSLNNWMCQVSLGAKSFLPVIADEIIISYSIPAVILVMSLLLFKEDKSVFYKQP